MPMDGAPTAEHCADPCCMQHRLPHRAPQKSHWCAYQCAASVPATARELPRSSADAGYPPTDVLVGMEIMIEQTKADASSVPDPDPPLPFALPLRI